MNFRLQAIVEQGLLRPLEPMPFLEKQQVTLTISDEDENEVRDVSFLRYMEAEADDSITIDAVRSALGKIPGSLAEDVRRERDERS